jgi:hypothetical protein
MRWYARPTRIDRVHQVEPRLASWDAADHPDQLRLQAYLNDAEALLAHSRVEGPWALRLDVGRPTDRDLLDGADLDNYAYPLASRINDPDLVSVWCTKQRNDQSFVRIEQASEQHQPATGVLVVRTTTSTSTIGYKEQIHAAIAHAAELPVGPVRLELTFVVGPRRNWLNLWKPTIDSLDPLLGRTYPDRAYHPRDGRIIDLGMHVSVDPAVGNEVTVGIAAAQMQFEESDASSVLRGAAVANGWQVLIENGEYPLDTYQLPDRSTRIEVLWGGAGVLMASAFGDDVLRSSIWRPEDPETKTERVLSALTSRTAEFPPAPDQDEPLIDRIRRRIRGDIKEEAPE